MSDQKPNESDKLRVAERRALMSELRLAGIISGRKLAAAMLARGYHVSPATIRRDIKAVAEQFNLEAQGNEQTYRDFMTQRLSEEMAAIWPACRKGDLGAIDRDVKLQERLAKLQGADAPLKSETKNDTTNTERLELSDLTDDVLEAHVRALFHDTT
jgi:predicted DNA-binding transcriptional regulator YafY